MAKYNAAAHRIETDDGRILATLTPLVETSQAWEIADGWSRYSEELRSLREEVASECGQKHHEREWREKEEEQRRDAESLLLTARIRIEELEAEIATLKEKGDAAA